MEVQTISWSKKITAKLSINVDTIEYKNSIIHGDSFELPFSISDVGDGSDYHGQIVLVKKSGKRYLSCYVYDVKDLTGKVSMMTSEEKIISNGVACTCGIIPNAKEIYFTTKNAPITFLKGSFTITFETLEKKTIDKRLINSYSVLKQDQLQEMKEMVLKIPKLDNTIIAQYKYI